MENNIPIFIADVHLGKLARLLRMLGFNTAYGNAFSNAALIQLAEEQNRILLTRNIHIGQKHPSLLTFIITHDDPGEQSKNVLQRFHLLQHIQPFTRCMVCNGIVEAVSKEKIINELPEKTAIYYHEFWQCSNCHRIYWKGPHYNRMMRFIQQLIEEKM